MAASAPDNRREHQAHATEEDTAAPCHAASALHARRLGALGDRAQHARPGRPGRRCGRVPSRGGDGFQRPRDARRGASAASRRASPSPPCSSAAPHSRQVPAMSSLKPSRARRRPSDLHRGEPRPRRLRRRKPCRGSSRGRGRRPRRLPPRRLRPGVRPTPSPGRAGRPGRGDPVQSPATAASLPPSPGTATAPSPLRARPLRPLPTPDDPDESEPAPAPPPGVGEGARPIDPRDLPVIDRSTRSPAELDPEADADGFFATIWLHRPLPDPTPPAKRLTPRFARTLAQRVEERTRRLGAGARSPAGPRVRRSLARHVDRPQHGQAARLARRPPTSARCARPVRRRLRRPRPSRSGTTTGPSASAPSSPASRRPSPRSRSVSSRTSAWTSTRAAASTSPSAARTSACSCSCATSRSPTAR